MFLKGRSVQQELVCFIPRSAFPTPQEQQHTHKQKIPFHLTKTDTHFETFLELTGRNCCSKGYKTHP